MGDALAGAMCKLAQASGSAMIRGSRFNTCQWQSDCIQMVEEMVTTRVRWEPGLGDVGEGNASLKGFGGQRQIASRGSLGRTLCGWDHALFV